MLSGETCRLLRVAGSSWLGKLPRVNLYVNLVRVARILGEEEQSDVSRRAPSDRDPRVRESRAAGVAWRTVSVPPLAARQVLAPRKCQLREV
ncbi:hypothetical protein E2C01_038098 [Portunus trituberculatus]|uniref:Uncharacterized protein n=1 Tax=Portunus trituberculatus TaxID=210409 RepID=A0A5B7FFW4_PORTR|nr:hypothetical protein [Portunus trituberculatus]